MKSSTGQDRKDIVEKVGDRFTSLVAAINQKDAGAWEKFYSKDEFLGAFAGGTCFASRNDWVQAITANFSTRASQELVVLEMQVTPLTPDRALLTSQNRVDMQLQNGQSTRSDHMFTMLWKKGTAGWEIVHSHESWVNQSGK